MSQHPKRQSATGAQQPRATPADGVEAVTSHDRFLALRDEWGALRTRDPRASIFLHHAWADAAWAWRVHEAAPLLLLVRRSSDLKGIVPLCRHRTHGRAYELSWLSVPDNQEADLVCAPGDRETVVEALAGWLARTRRYWSRLTLAQLPADGPTLPALLAALEAHGMPAAGREAERNPFIDLTTGWEAFYGTRSRRLKKGNNLIANRLQRAGAVTVDRVTGEDVTPAIGETLRQLSAASWKQATRTTFDHPGPGAFLDTLIERGRAEGWLVVWLLTLDGETIASELHLEYAGRAHALRADYAEHAGELSPGSYLNWKIIERLFESALDRYELGPGTNPYKQRWTEEGLPLATIDAWPPTAIGRLKALWHLRLRPALVRLKRRTRRSPAA